MARWVFVFIASFIIVIFSGFAEAEENKGEDQPIPETVVVTGEDKEIIEVIEMLPMMELLEDLEFVQELDLFLEENTNEKED